MVKSRMIVLLALLLTACQTAAPTLVPTPLPTAAPAPSATPFTPPTPTPRLIPLSAGSSGSTEGPGLGGFSYDTPAPASSGSLAEEGKNQAGFGSRFAEGDLFSIAMEGLPQPPAGQTYQAWLLKDDGSPFALGIVPVAQDGTVRFEWVSPTGENLLNTYRRFQITLEGDQPSAAPQGRVFYFGGLEPEAWAMAQTLFVKNNREPVTPLNTALVPGLRAQLDVAIQHIHNAENAAQIGALAEMRNHLEHTINILEGSGGARFKDYNGDGAAQNPGDGFGTRAYARETAALLNTPEARAAAQKLDAAIIAIQDRCEAIIALQDLAEAKAGLAEIETVLAQANDDAAALMDLAAHAIWFPVVEDAGG